MSYSPTLGRFLETDPEGYTDGANLYQYERSNPVNLVDPLGTRADYPERVELGPGWRADMYLFDVQVIGDGYAGDNSSNPPADRATWPSRAFTGTMKFKLKGLGLPIGGWLSPDEIEGMLRDRLMTPANELPGNCTTAPPRWLPSRWDIDGKIYIKFGKYTIGLEISIHADVLNVVPRN